MSYLLAVLPVAVMLGLLFLVKCRAAIASAVSFGVAVAVALFAFRSPLGGLGLDCVRGAWSAFAIFYVTITAILIYDVMEKSGMFLKIKNAVCTGIRSDLLRVLFICCGFTGFLQGITGFGVPVAVAAVILTGMGLDAVSSVVLCILGHTWGGTFGTLALAWDNLLLSGGVEKNPQIVAVTCLLLWAYNFACLITICFVYRKGKPSLRDFLCAAVVSAAQGGGQLLFAEVNTSAACFFGASLSIAVILLLDRILNGKHTAQKIRISSLADTAAPFLFLTALILLLLIKPVQAFLSQFRFGPMLPDASGKTVMYSPFSPLTHSGTILLLSALFSYVLYRKRGYLQQGAIWPLLKKTLLRSLRAIVPILFLIMMSKVMDGAGCFAILSSGIAALVGSAYPAVAPIVGSLGAIVTSSNMSSNILFAGFQRGVADRIGVNVNVILAAQTSGGAVGNLLSTGNIVLGMETTGHAGEEGTVFRKLLPIFLINLVLCCALTWLASVVCSV